ncbi:helix-turn-helix domain-containing protein [Actinomadura logoneensis]|nr:helix-turn-helix transcriptional regulator [Actinomadura logoneensis]
MSPRRQRPTSEPALKAFGSQMKRHRNRASITQDAIAGRTHVSASFVSQVENGKKACKRDFAMIADQMTGANGALLELWEDLYKDGSPVPGWFADWSAIEGEAESLVWWEPMIIPGLLQTESYAREFLTSETAVKSRLERQEILTRDDPPPIPLTVLLTRAALTYPVGTRATMQEQLQHLVALAERPNISLQVVTYFGRPVAIGGAFGLATLPDRSQVAYLETTVRGITTDARDDLSSLSEALRKLQSKALPENQSLDVIQKEIEAL